MPQRSTLIISAAITMFVLVIVGGLVTRVMSQTAALPATEAPAPTAEPATPAPPAPPADPLAGVQSQIDQREAAYQSRITESNDRLQQANDQLALAYQKQQELAAQLREAYQKQQDLAAQLKRAQAAPPQTIVEHPAQPAPAQPQAAPPQPQAPAAPTYPVSADAAGAIALAAEPGTQLTAKPELVDFQGTVAYEVVLDAGKVYVDANTGQILYDGVAANKLAQQGGGGEHEHEGGEHEGEHDD